MARFRNPIALIAYLLVWLYLFVPNPYLSFLSASETGRQIDDDLLFLWLPGLIAVLTYFSYSGRWHTRLVLAIILPALTIASLFLLAVTGVLPSEAGWAIIFLMFPLRSYIIVLAIVVFLSESIRRFLSKQSIERS